MSRLLVSARSAFLLAVFAMFAFVALHSHRPRLLHADIPIGVTYICGGEHIYIENCNMRDTSDTSNCMVAHPDHLTPTGINSYTNVTRGALKKLLPTCRSPPQNKSRRPKPSSKNSRISTTPT